MAAPIILCDTAGMTNEQWLDARMHGPHGKIPYTVGGSDVAAIFGVSPWTTPLELWNIKKGRMKPPKKANANQLEMGHLLEPIAAHWYAKKTGNKEKPFSIIIDKVMVFPQAYAAVVPQSSLIVNTPRIFIVDIGGYTTDVLLLKNGKLDFQFCRSLESGVITMNNEIIRKVNSYHDMLLEDEHISDVLCGKDIYLPEDVVETIKGATKQHASNILNQLRELQVDLRSNPAIFVGGGSILLRPFLENSPMVMRGSFVDSPNANALGYEMLGRTQMLRPNA